MRENVLLKMEEVFTNYDRIFSAEAEILRELNYCVTVLHTERVSQEQLNSQFDNQETRTFRTIRIVHTNMIIWKSLTLRHNTVDR